MKTSSGEVNENNVLMALTEVIDDFDRELSISGIPPESFTLLTDGQLHIRQALMPEAQRKGVKLPKYYFAFHDLRKEFAAKYPSALKLESVDDMLKHFSEGENKVKPDEDGNDEIDNKDVDDDDDGKNENPERQAEKMGEIVHKMICDDKLTFHDPDVIRTKLEQGIRSRGDAVDSESCVRARGLPWQASDQDIAKFFYGLNVAKGGVALCLSAQGRRNGEALVLFENSQHRDMALKRHKHHIGNRYIEVYKATGEDFISVAGGKLCTHDTVYVRPV